MSELLAIVLFDFRVCDASTVSFWDKIFAWLVNNDYCFSGSSEREGDLLERRFILYFWFEADLNFGILVFFNLYSNSENGIVWPKAITKSSPTPMAVTRLPSMHFILSGAYLVLKSPWPS